MSDIQPRHRVGTGLALGAGLGGLGGVVGAAVAGRSGGIAGIAAGGLVASAVARNMTVDFGTSPHRGAFRVVEVAGAGALGGMVGGVTGAAAGGMMFGSRGALVGAAIGGAVSGVGLALAS